MIGREGDLAIDENAYLHRQFLRVYRAEQLWWLVNVGSRLGATVSDRDGVVQAFLAPGGHIPLVFAATVVRFSAGSTTYELSINLDQAVFDPPAGARSEIGETTAAPPTMNREQRLLLLALTEPILRRGDRSVSAVPTSAEAASRLGWSLTKFNRKLDHLCEKLDAAGIRGLRGSGSGLASNRRFRLVEYGLAANLVTVDDLPLLDAAPVAARS